MTSLWDALGVRYVTVSLENTADEIATVELNDDTFELAPGEARTVYRVPESARIQSDIPIDIRVLDI